MRLASTGIHGPRVVVPIWAQQNPQAFILLPPARRRQRMSRSVAVAPQLPPASGVLAAPSPLLASATTPAALRACSSRPVPPDSFAAAAAATPFDVLFDPLPLHRERALSGCSAKCSSVLPLAAPRRRPWPSKSSCGRECVAPSTWLVVLHSISTPVLHASAYHLLWYFYLRYKQL